jgi:anti-sigma B factor antagonist
MILEANTRMIEPDIILCDVRGRLSLGNSLMLLENSIRKAIQGGARKIIFDLSKLSSIDSAGIGFLLSSSGLIEQNGGRMLISGAQGNVAHTFEIVHLDRVVSLLPDVDSAILNFGSASGQAAGS